MTERFPLGPRAPITPEPLALRPAAAAKTLGIGQRKLWELTKAGTIPHVKIGVCTVYRVETLREWLRQQEAAQAEGGSR